MSIECKLEAKTIGPHNNLQSTENFSSLNIGMFATNGSGKSFLSRMFRLLGKDDINSEDTDKLISIGQDSGGFSFSVKSGANLKDVSIKLHRGNLPEINDNMDYLFHVFNSNYVAENLEAHKYTPDGDIEGYVLGKVNIDLTAEKEDLQEIVTNKEALIEQVYSGISKARIKLDTLHISKNLTEYKLLQYERMYAGETFLEEDAFSQLIKLHETLKAMPDDFEDITNTLFEFKDNALEEAKALLEAPYNRSTIAQAFKDKVKNKQDFIEEGVSLLKEGDTCPFCEQNLSEDALHLIDEYNIYLEDVEAKVRRTASRLIQSLDSLEKEIKSAVSKISKERNRFNEVKKFIPSYSEEELSDVPDYEIVKFSFQALKNNLETKTEAISRIDFSHDEHINHIISYLEQSRSISEQNGNKITTLNKKKNDIQSEKRELGRRLCKASFMEEKSRQDDRLAEIKVLEAQEGVLQTEIVQKESKEKASKRDKVAEALKTFLNYFFKGKYELDDDTFNIKFLNKKLAGDTNPSDVLSDGEKSIVAFCYYLAETHKRVSVDDDYNKLFFIIDDPISSLDFHYVYAVAQIIRSLKASFEIQGHLRYIVLTHSIEFMSILIRNKIIAQKLILEQGKIRKLNKHLIMPYESHLRDVFHVSKDSSKASHTTPNSIRHVLETLCRFESPNEELSGFFEKIEELNGNEFVYSLMHDGSHGVLRQEHAHTPEMIQSGCLAVINYVRTKFEGQINHIEQG